MSTAKTAAKVKGEHTGEAGLTAAIAETHRRTKEIKAKPQSLTLGFVAITQTGFVHPDSLEMGACPGRERTAGRDGIPIPQKVEGRLWT